MGSFNIIDEKRYTYIWKTLLKHFKLKIMKKYFLFLSLIYSSVSFAQKNLGATLTATQNIIVNETQLVTEVEKKDAGENAVKKTLLDYRNHHDGNERILRKGTLFQVKEVLQDGYIIAIVPYKDLDKFIKNNRGTSIEDQNIFDVYVGHKLIDNNMLFFMKSNDLALYTQEAESKWSVTGIGATVLPIKFRLGDGNKMYFDFGRDVTIGTTAGVRYKIGKDKPIYFSFLGGLGVSSISLDSKNVDQQGFEPQSVIALTPSMGFTLEAYKVQLGVFVGWDHIAGDLGRKWIYQGEHWWSIGLGVSLFNFDIGGVGSKQGQ